MLLEAARAPHESPHAYWISFYVGVSRAPSLDRLLLLGEPDWDALRAGPPPELVQELERLAGLAAATAARLARAIAIRRGALPAGIRLSTAPPTTLDVDTPTVVVPEPSALASLDVARLRALLRRSPFGADAFGCASAPFAEIIAKAPRARLEALLDALRLAPPPRLEPPDHFQCRLTRNLVGGLGHFPCEILESHRWKTYCFCRLRLKDRFRRALWTRQSAESL